MLEVATSESDYRQYADIKSWKSENFGTFSEAEARYFEIEIGSPSLPGHQALFELGFGNGSLLGWARAKGYQVMGFELQSSLMERAVHAGFPIADDPAKLAEQSFDVIVALDVFEHIAFHELAELVSRLFLALKPGGKLVARFPNGDSPFSMPTFNGDQTHINWMGAGQVWQLMQLCNIGDYEIRAPSEPPGNIAGAIKLFGKKILRALFLKFAQLAFLGGAAPPTYCPNYTLIARKPGPGSATSAS